VDEGDAYTLLGLDATASPSELKVAYRRLVKEWHPDRFLDDPERSAEAAERTQQIIAAYRSLTPAADSGREVSQPSGPETFEAPLWRQWNPFDPSQIHYGPNTLGDRVAIASVLVVGVVLLILFGIVL